MKIFRLKEMHMLQEMWFNLSLRDQRAALLGGACLALALIYFLIWSPIHSAVTEEREALADQTQLLVYVREAEKKLANVDVVAMRKEKVKSALELLSFLKSKIDDFSLTTALTNIKQAGNDGVALTFKNVQFNECVRFLVAVLNAKRVEIQQFSSSSAAEPGYVNISLVITI